ncbi:high affinity copper uptake protein 1-like [Centruroides sculpturatus]|uniref:high affinity copper uptake protein 1-like n=1 Tax=Centruroides sculpturatus TaxID=218467 RepID=UPI000C6D778A|nr:high affinity copper uptake protein 1-like [Centruroides sculpturatus]XP_023234684.1 high affinity copper uptake protein 1-like [Centruroides sculpturatus]XP_023234685.1 high affinity copper uptake protein 1-like [Centruroides sculpturatus]
MSEAKSYFDFGCHIQNLLFKGVSVSSVGGMIGLCIGTAFLTLSYESMKVFRHRLTLLQSKRSDSIPRSESSRSENDFLVTRTLSAQTLKRLKFHFVQTILYVLQVVLGYFLMLIIMSYNVWLAITIFLTSGCCYYLFGVFVLSRSVVVPIEFMSTDDH